MPLDLFALTFDANDPRCLEDFWAEVLGRTETDDHGDGARHGRIRPIYVISDR